MLKFVGLLKTTFNLKPLFCQYLQKQILIVVFFLFGFSCLGQFQMPPLCDSLGQKAIEGVENGELQALKDYLEHGGDPLYSCSKVYTSGGHYGTGLVLVLLSDAVMRSESFEIVEYYLTYSIPEDVKSEMLTFFSVPDCSHCQELVKLLVEKKAIFKAECCFFRI